MLRIGVREFTKHKHEFGPWPLAPGIRSLQERGEDFKEETRLFQAQALMEL